jgi:hypothetical protein
MTLRIVPYTAEHEEAVQAFNARLAAKSLDPNLYSTRFPPSHVPTWLPYREGCDLYQEYFVAIDENSVVRGGYILKRQPFLVKGKRLQLAAYRLPISEGIIDRRFVNVAMHLYSDALRREPYLFGVGGGSYGIPAMRFLLAAGWKTVLTPFWFRIVHPKAFVHNITVLRTSALRRWALDVLGYSGVGWAGTKAMQCLQGRHRIPRDVSYETALEFGDWADDVWDASKGCYTLIAIRSQTNLNANYPASNPRFIRLKIMRNDRVIGWAVLLNTKMSGHKQFGDMRVGTIVGTLSMPEDASDVIACALDVLEAEGADLIISNQGSRVWGQALKCSGFLQGPSNFPFFASPKLAAELEPFLENAPMFHLNRGDGDGPIHL